MHSSRTTRIAAGALVIAAHCVGILLMPPFHQRTPASRGETTLVYLDVRPVEKAPAPEANPERPPARSVSRPVVPAGAAPSNAITVVPPPEIRAQPNWRAEADHAVTRYGERLAEEDRRAASMGRPEVATDPLVAPTTPDFGWSKANTERVTQLEGGGTMIRLGERCAIVIVLIPMPACAFGKIKPRSDLFEHMDDPPKPGDWKY